MRHATARLMINAVALGLLLSYLGAVVVLVPEPHLIRDSQHVLLQEDVRPPEASTVAEHAAVNTLLKVAGATQSETPSVKEQFNDKVHQGVEKTADAIGSVKESAKDIYEKVKEGVQEKARDAYSSVPSVDEVASNIPGRHKTRGALETMKAKLQNSQRVVEEPIRDAASSVSGENSGSDALESLHKKLQDSQRGLQESICDAVSYFDGDRELGFTETVGEVFNGVTERLSAAEEQQKNKLSLFKREPHAEGAVLAAKVQEFCNWFAEGSVGSRDTGGGGGGQEVSMDAKESFRYLTDAAKGAIEGTRRLFGKAVAAGDAGGGGLEWREKYKYLADSAEGALDGAREVFERVVASKAGSGRSALTELVQRVKETANETSERGGGEEEDWAAERGSVGAQLKRAAERAKGRLSGSLHALLRAFYVAIFSVIYGIALWMTFVSGHLLALAVPRHQLAVLQSKLFPVYLRLMSSGLALCFAIHAFIHPLPSADPTERWQYCNFASSLAACLLNTFHGEPRATKAMLEKLKMEKEEGDEGQKAVDVKLKDMHAYSSWLNVVSVGGLTWHLWYLANRLLL